MADITVIKVLENQLMKFKVVVSEEKSQTEHLVTLNRADYQRTTDGDVKPELLIEKAFEFLLENEPKEEILAQFDYTMIDRYFPHFHREIQKRLEQI
ncbi:MAG: hypothetical protein A3A65_01275 [Candidatus Chisholmbacteria bacterium RIFCSPLOWO2_01_FULL_49_14]|uniref:Phage protein n=1 Tax=Candidatus Chisholmbacteria bacterium RIFCSPLOWO2_01_FULL_49_14 TaxID=1797593 RepID=A0A1G1VZE6_9BACT|nr:MAG: hypothetical protein A3A65_01275 [Candidatus Chisholmbacteria bacterium RIFCSPLOWO2_01_FULL_49_14]